MLAVRCVALRWVGLGSDIEGERERDKEKEVQLELDLKISVVELGGRSVSDHLNPISTAQRLPLSAPPRPFPLLSRRCSDSLLLPLFPPPLGVGERPSPWPSLRNVVRGSPVPPSAPH